MPDLPVLDAAEQRILGSLLEKQRTVPASYPLTLSALRGACNQTSRTAGCSGSCGPTRAGGR
jgi:uncharacterized protein YceH (UPF0502 family)